MANTNISRRGFIKASALTGLGATIAGLANAGSARAAEPASSSGRGGVLQDTGGIPPRAGGQSPVHTLTTKPIERVRVGVIGLHRGMEHVNDCLAIEFAEVVAVCDLRVDRAQAAAEACVKQGGRRPAVYSGAEDAWEKMVDRDDIDIVYIATPWAWHVPMCLRTMERGKHAFVEVAAAMTVGDCWQLVNASERTQCHCVMLENCCYGENELFVLSMVRQGVFGELTHAECGYIHDLRQVLFELGAEGDWRRDYHRQLDGNLYPTHGLGPVAQYLGLGRGDQFKVLVSMSSIEAGLTRYRDGKQPNGGRHAAEKYVCGDMNTSIIKTELGRTVMIQHSVVSPRPYSRINAVSGTGGTFFDYPARLAINDPTLYGLEAKGSHEWLGEKDLAKMRQMFAHPLWTRLAERAAGSGHGGMDYVMNWRHLDCVRRGITPDSVVYDAAAWSCIVELSTRSVAAGGMPVGFPDFTRGHWKTMKPIGIAEAAAQRA
jgi:predicted dehydrogenase